MFRPEFVPDHVDEWSLVRHKQDIIRNTVTGDGKRRYKTFSPCDFFIEWYDPKRQDVMMHRLTEDEYLAWVCRYTWINLEKNSAKA